MIAKQVFFEGYVQGVGFRYTTRQVATGYEVVGWVRNLADGRVELQCMGEPDEVMGFIKAIKEGDLGSLIRTTEEHEIPLLKGARGFEIRHDG